MRRCRQRILTMIASTKSASAPKGSSRRSVRYHFQRRGQTHGPVSGIQLRELVASGNLGRDDLVRREDSENWAPAGTIRGLFADPAQTSNESHKAPLNPSAASAPLPVKNEDRPRVPAESPVPGPTV